MHPISAKFGFFKRMKSVDHNLPNGHDIPGRANDTRKERKREKQLGYISYFHSKTLQTPLQDIMVENTMKLNKSMSVAKPGDDNELVILGEASAVEEDVMKYMKLWTDKTGDEDL